MELHGCPDQPMTELAADPTGKAAGRGTIILLRRLRDCGLFQRGGKQLCGFAAEQDFGKTKVFARSLLAHDTHWQSQWTKGRKPLKATPALNGETVATGLKTGHLEGGKALEVEIAPCGASCCQNGPFQVID